MTTDTYAAAIEAAARVAEAEVIGVEVDVFHSGGITLRNREGHDKFVSTQRVSNLLRERAAAIRALSPAPPAASRGIGRWLSAALDDPAVCEEMKADIRAWFDAGEPPAPPAASGWREPIPAASKGQAAVVMALHGSPEQKAEAAAFITGASPLAPPPLPAQAESGDRRAWYERNQPTPEQAKAYGLLHEQYFDMVKRAEAAEARCRELEEAACDEIKWATEKDLARKRSEARCRELEGENARLRTIVSRSAEALGNGAVVSPDCSLEFMAQLPAEISMRCRRLEGEVERAKRERDTWVEQAGRNAVAADTITRAAKTAETALRAAQQFIHNGRELGFIRMPDITTPDSAHRTPGLVDAALSALTAALGMSDAPAQAALDLREAIARTVYSIIPNGGEVRVPSTAPGTRWTKEYRADTWEEAPDRHADCFAIADALLAPDGPLAAIVQNRQSADEGK